MTKIPLKVVVWKEGEHYVAWCLNNSISSFGESRKDAMKNLEEALELYYEDESVLEVSKVERPSIVPFTFVHT